jgi:hypothetical protein
MAWSRELRYPITLKDGRKLEILGQAREIMLSVPDVARNGILWRHVAALLEAAAAGNAPVSEVQGMLMRGLKAAGLL